MALKALIYVVLFLSIAQVVISSSSTSSDESEGPKNMKDGVQYRGANKNYIQSCQKPLKGDCACHGHSKMGVGEEVMVEREDKTEWFIKVLKETVKKGKKLYDDIKNMKEITFPIDGYKNKDIAILHGLKLEDVKELYKAVVPTSIKFYSPAYPPLHEMLIMIANVSGAVIDHEQLNEEKAKEAKKKAMDDAIKAKKAPSTKFTKSKSMAKDSSKNSKKNQASLGKSKSSLSRRPSATRGA